MFHCNWTGFLNRNIMISFLEKIMDLQFATDSMYSTIYCLTLYVPQANKTQDEKEVIIRDHV